MESRDQQELWAEICFLLSENINPDIQEKDFESQVIRVMEKLGWFEYKGEIQRQPIIQMGRKNSIRPDIVISDPDKKSSIVMEIKRPIEDLAKDEATGQLKSYMRQVKSAFGLLIGNKIRMYYDGELNPQQEPLLLDEISFNKSSKSGRRFVAIFEKDSFINRNYESYLNQLIEKFKAKRNIKKLKTILSTEDTKTKIIDYLKKEFTDYGSDIVDEALNDLIVTLSFKGSVTKQPPKQPPPSEPPTKERFKPGSSVETLLRIIQSHPSGISVPEIIKKTQFSHKKIANLVYKLKRQGKIDTIDKGVYAPIKKAGRPLPIIKQTGGIRETVYKFIKSDKRGVTFEELSKATPYDIGQLYNAVHSLKKQGKVDNISKGVYIAIS